LKKALVGQTGFKIFKKALVDQTGFKIFKNFSWPNWLKY
jgi:hypothetical protein